MFTRTMIQDVRRLLQLRHYEALRPYIINMLFHLDGEKQGQNINNFLAEESSWKIGDKYHPDSGRLFFLPIFKETVKSLKIKFFDDILIN